ncbi:MAG: anhydro-N-acetylmuramic acid kinase [Hyphomicrobiaceae bacterium]|nr:anhydro-N-acetylmuramic acid kinase [Hyphomicrobiaceae bacterium]
MGKLVRALGLMSGTSMDGIDVAVIETEGESLVVRGPRATRSYPPDFRERLLAAVEDARGLQARAARPGCLAAVERELTERHAEAVAAFLAEHAVAAADVDVIGFHGHTVLHRPQAGAGTASGAADSMTVQIGDGSLLASLTGIDVVYDLRAADVAAGGQGAPLAPVYHRALAARLPQRPVAFLNVGGVANVTWVGEDGRLIAFDTGPGNALLDDWAQRHTGKPCDVDGALARSGVADEEVLRQYLLHPHFERPVPKSLDRNDFSLAPVAALAPADGAATLALLTAAAVARSLGWFPTPPALWLVAGGGRRNKHLMELLAWHLEAPVAPVEAVDLDGDSMEAEAWAYLAVRSLAGLPITYPGTTGVPGPLTGGILARAPAG